MHTGEWEHFLYVGKVTFFGWALHFCMYFVRPSLTRVGEADAVTCQ